MFRLLVAFAAFALPLSLACGDGPEDEVTLMLDWTPNTHHIGVYVAQEKGWYEDVGLTVKIVEPAQGGVEQIVGAGQVEFGVSVQENVIPARAAEIPIISIAAIKQHNDSSLVSLSSEGIARPRDLEGRTYGGFGGPLEIALIEQLVSCDGGDPDQVKFAQIGNVDYLVGLEDDLYDIVWIFEGWDAIRYRDLEQKQISSLKFSDWLKCIPDWYTPLLIANEQMLADEPELVESFLEATARGYAFAIENPSEAAAILIEAVPELNEDLVSLSTAYHTTRFMDPGRKWGRQDEDVWVAFEVFLREAGLTDVEVDVGLAFTNEFLP